MIIKKADISFAQAIYNVHLQSNDKFWKQKDIASALQNEFYDLFVCIVDEKVVGYVNAISTMDSSDICFIAVSNDYKRQGIAYNLLSHLEKYLVQNGCKKIFLEVNENNKPAIALYEKLGYNQIYIRKGYYNGEDAINMQKNL